MSSRLIEECFETENFRDNYISVEVDKDTFFVVVDPYIVNVQDLIHLKLGVPGVVRIRRPGWGRCDVREVIRVVKIGGE